MRTANSSVAKHRAGRRRRGLTLLEAILAATILGLSMAAIGTLVHFGATMAEQARDGTTAQLIAESVMSQVVSGNLPAESIGLTEYYQDDPTWLYSITVAPLAQTGSVELPLLEVRVLVQENPQVVTGPNVFEMVRWIPDAAALPAEEEPTEDESADGLSLMEEL